MADQALDPSRRAAGGSRGGTNAGALPSNKEQVARDAVCRNMKVTRYVGANKRGCVGKAPPQAQSEGYASSACVCEHVALEAAGDQGTVRQKSTR